MQALRDGDDANTRELTKRESAILSRSLRSGKLQAIEKPGRIDMVAPIYAQKRCLRCHDTEEGAPLGAFSYVLEPEVVPESREPEALRSTKPNVSGLVLKLLPLIP